MSKRQKTASWQGFLAFCILSTKIRSCRLLPRLRCKMASQRFELCSAVHLFLPQCDHMAWFPLNALPQNAIPYVRRALANFFAGRWFDSYGWHGEK